MTLNSLKINRKRKKKLKRLRELKNTEKPRRLRFENKKDKNTYQLWLSENFRKGKED